jgi:hypothetical protein
MINLFFVSIGRVHTAENGGQTNPMRSAPVA